MFLQMYFLYDYIFLSGLTTSTEPSSALIFLNFDFVEVAFIYSPSVLVCPGRIRPPCKVTDR